MKGEPLMKKETLPAHEYEKIIHFASEIVRPAKNIRFHIQQQLHLFFGYHSSIFWDIDDEGNLSNPSAYFIDDQFMSVYLKEFHQIDVLHPKKYLPLFLERNILRISDIMSWKEYEKSYYYQFLMKRYGFYDQLGIVFTYNNLPIGAIGMAKHESQKHFTELDCMRFHYLSKIISSVLLHEIRNEWKHSLLSKREKEVVKLVKEGKTNAAIAKELHVSINTVKKHLQNIYQKYNVQNRIQLIEKLRSHH